MKKENPPRSSTEDKVASRRGFLFKTISIVPAVEQTPAGATASSAAANYQPRYFNTDEWIFIKAAVDRLIPADNEGPGAQELNVANFIDGPMESGFGHASNWYMQGPFKGNASPLFDYQANMPPRELYRAGIAALNDYCRKNFSVKNFAQLSPTNQEKLFKDMDGGKITFETVSAQWFFYLSAAKHQGRLSGRSYPRWQQGHGGQENDRLPRRTRRLCRPLGQGLSIWSGRHRRQTRLRLFTSKRLHGKNKITLQSEEQENG